MKAWEQEASSERAVKVSLVVVYSCKQVKLDCVCNWLAVCAAEQVTVREEKQKAGLRGSSCAVIVSQFKW